MKTIPLLILVSALTASHLLVAQSLEMDAAFHLSQPIGPMARNMNNAFGLSLGLEKYFKTPFSAGLQMSFGNYGYQTSRQQYTFSDGSVTETNVNVGNNIFNMFLTGKHYLRNHKPVNPYLSAKAGWMWFSTNLTVEDPGDAFSCHPIESEIIARDNTYSVSGGAGLRLDFNTIFNRMEIQRLFFDLNVHATHGGIVEYMNVRQDPRQPVPDRDIMVRFLNTQSQVVHEHHVGYLYSSVLSMMEYRFGVVYRP
ncbi:MAG: hypothetical protein WA874_14195 [Chryseosolibacter sp.]